MTQCISYLIVSTLCANRRAHVHYVYNLQKCKLIHKNTTKYAKEKILNFGNIMHDFYLSFCFNSITTVFLPNFYILKIYICIEQSGELAVSDLLRMFEDSAAK